jgi:phosphatidylinositol alpha-mannosyltransferase
VLCAPFALGESFGMVLTEAFAAGTPVIASTIAGYSDVVTDGVDGCLVPPGDPPALAEELQRVYPRARAACGRWGEAARESAQRYAWPRVADQVTAVYERAIAAPKPARPASGAPTGRAAPADGCRGARRAASLARSAPAQAGKPRRADRPPRRLAVAGALGVGLTCSPRRRSASTTWSKASSARTSPGCWSPAR